MTQRLKRRQILTGTLALLAQTAAAAPEEPKPMFGMIGKMIAAAGKRDDLLAMLLGNKDPMPGCLSYIIAKDPADEVSIWITEVWTDKASHDASLALPAVRKTIAAARPLIAGFDTSVVTTPLGGVGLPK